MVWRDRGYLSDLILPGTNVAFVTNNAHSGTETLTISATGSGGGGSGVAVAPGTNVTTSTNAGVVTVSADVSHAEVTAATNDLNTALTAKIASSTNTLDASQLNRGTVPTARLSSQVAVQNGDNTKVWTGLGYETLSGILDEQPFNGVNITGQAFQTTNAITGDPLVMTNITLTSALVSGGLTQELQITQNDPSKNCVLSVGGTNNSPGSYFALESVESVVENGGTFFYRTAGTHNFEIAVNGGSVATFPSTGGTGVMTLNAGNVTLNESGDMEITGKFTADGSVDPPGFVYDANTRWAAKARDLLEVPDAVTNIYWIGLIGANNAHRLLSNEVFSTVISTNDLSRVQTYTNKVNQTLARILATYTNLTVNSVIARTNVQPSKLTGMFVFDEDAANRLEMYRASDDTFYTAAGLQITNNLPTTNQVISAMQAIIAVKQAKANLLQ
jgi:hypothetical protein